ncbi:FKBP-type peptidylprolyl isomerase [Flavobacterium silvisoli]|uniref:FKBP-type peptidylprolyl isomerase n=1 Tax=Flavobacterium silvisoli TaxID=2529433 RepID=A0A4Q9YQK4_9FLAO|nr:FKBP-type peptidylprolyl isomerase [Flavobacterium silvisoli]TBX65762.1 FKBP-type peptidylprolyl isomerase [Flavobacterium silvisoli]
MNNFLKPIVLFFFCLLVVSCSKSDSSSEPLRDYTEQYTKDIANIETFMKTHYMTVVNNPNGEDDLDVTFTKITATNNQVSIWDQTQYPIRTREITVKQNNVDVAYKIYYIPLRGEVNRSSSPAADLAKAPCNVDQVLAAYRGEYIYNGSEGIISKQFEESKNPETFFNLYGGVIRGWSEVFPNFRAGSYAENPDGTVSFSDFGAGIMFLPSGLAYFSGTGSQGGAFPSYSPLIFSFKLIEIKRNDQDKDGIPSYLEDLDNDGYVATLATGVANPDNSDGVAVLMPNGKYTKTDEIPDFLDVDDDNDEVMTKIEIKNPLTGIAYPFADIPTCGGGNGKKKYLDPSCH